MNNLTPLSDLHDWLHPWGERIGWSADGYAKSPNIYLNQEATKKIMDLTGVNRLQLNLEYMEGVNQPDTIYKVEDDSTWLLYNQEPISITFNRTRLGSEVADYRQEFPNCTYEEAWADVLNSTVRRNLGALATKKLLPHSSGWEALTNLFSVASVTTLAMTAYQTIAMSEYAASAAVVSAGYYTVAYGARRRDAKKAGYGLGNVRKSLFLGTKQYDRWLAAQVKLRTRDLIQYTPATQ